MTIGINRHEGCAKIHSHRLLNDGQAASLPIFECCCDRGSIRDTVMYSVLAAEWQDVKRHLQRRLEKHETH